MQALTLLGVPLTIALTFLTLGFQVLLERLCEWDTCIPKATALPQNSHFAIMEYTSLQINRQIDCTSYNIKSKAILQAFFIFI